MRHCKTSYALHLLWSCDNLRYVDTGRLYLLLNYKETVRNIKYFAAILSQIVASNGLLQNPKNAQVNNPSCVMSMCRVTRPISDRQQPFWKDCRIFAASRYRWLLYIATDTTTTMATASAPYDVATICSVCLEPYQGRTPKLLPCFHTFCVPCLKDLEMHHKVSKITLMLPFWIVVKWNIFSLA